MAVLHRLYIEKLGASSVSSFVGNYGDIFYDPATITLRISDGVTPGGRLLVGGASSAPSASDITVTPSGTITTSTVQAALNELDAGKLAVAGGTMTGELILDGNTPIDPNAAVSKGFVEGFVADTIANGDITGNDIVFDNSATNLMGTDLQAAVVELDAKKLDKTGGALTGAVTTTQTVFAANELVTRDFVEQILNTEDTYVDTVGFNAGNGVLSLVNTDGTTITASGWDGRYLQLSGGTLTGDLIINAPSTDANSVATNSYVSNYVTNVINTGGIDSNTIVFDNSTTTLTATTVEGAIAELDANKVDRAGDTMLGYLTLYADPIAPLHAATKDYVDAAVTAGSGAALLNDLLDVNAVAPVDGATLRYDSGLTRWVLGSHVDTAGDTMTGFLSLHADPTAALHAATKQYVDASAAAAVASVIDTAPATLDTLNELAAALGDDPNFATTMTTALAGKVDLAGDTMTGFLNLHADPTLAAHAANKAYVDAQVGAVALNDLTDVDTTGVASGDVITFDGINWVVSNVGTLAGSTLAIENLSNVNNFASMMANNGDSLIWTGSAWNSGRPKALINYGTSAPSAISSFNVDGDLFIRTTTGTAGGNWLGTYVVEGGGWSEVAIPTQLQNQVINDLGDVDTTGVINGDVLAWDGINWVATALPPGTTDTFTANGSIDANGLITFTKSDLSTYAVDISGFAPSLGGLTNVDSEVDDPHSTNRFLSYSPGAGRWVADTSSVGWNGDVDLTGIANGQMLVWDESAGVRAFVPANVPSAPAETVTALSLAANILTYTDEAGANTALDLSLYLDDTNLARLTSGTVAANGMATFTRDDATTFDVDMSILLDTNTDALVDLTDTNVAAVTDGQVLTWDNATSMWVGKTPETVPDGTFFSQQLTWDDTNGWLTTVPNASMIWGLASDAAATTRISGTLGGAAVQKGGIYYNTTVNELRVYNGSAWETVGGAAASGDVVGPASSTDNAIARYDATSGKLIQNSAASVDDTGKLTAVGIVNDGSWAQKAYDFSGFAMSSGAYSLNVQNDVPYIKYNVSNAISLTITGGIAPVSTTAYAHSVTLELHMRGGSITLNNVDWPNGTAPTLTDGKKHLVMISTSDGGASYQGSHVGEYNLV